MEPNQRPPYEPSRWQNAIGPAIGIIICLILFVVGMKTNTWQIYVPSGIVAVILASLPLLLD